MNRDWVNITIYHFGNGDLSSIFKDIETRLSIPEYEEYQIYEIKTSSGLPHSDYGVTIYVKLGRNKFVRNNDGFIMHAI